MVAACLGGARVPGQLAEFVRAHSDGNPFLVEELLAGVVASGELRLRRRLTGPATGALTPTVPASLGESIRRRLTGLDPTARRVVGAAALLGRRFEWELLPGIAEVDGRAVVDGLRRAVDAQLVEVEGSGFRFRHALTREAVLADLLPPDRRAAGAACLAGRRAGPPGAARRLLRAGRRAGRGGGGAGGGRRRAWWRAPGGRAATAR